MASGSDQKNFSKLWPASVPPTRSSRWSAPGKARGAPSPSPPPVRRAEPPPPWRVSRADGRAASGRRRGNRPPARALPHGLPRRSMDYLTTFTGKSGRLLRGTASRLWGFGGGGEARQVRFEDYLREPAQGDPGCGAPPHRPPAPSSPEGPGEPSLPSPPARPTGLRAGGGGGPGAGWGRGGRRQVCLGRRRRGPGRREGSTRPARALGAEALLLAAAQPFLLCSSCFRPRDRAFLPRKSVRGARPSFALPLGGDW